MASTQYDVVVFSPHPDDAEFAMGGTIAKMAESGWEVVIVDLTDGEPTPLGTKQLRQEEAEKASRILGVEKRICLDMPNRYLQANLENRRKLAEIIRLHQPDLIFGPVVPDYHPDHIEAAKLLQAENRRIYAFSAVPPPNLPLTLDSHNCSLDDSKYVEDVAKMYPNIELHKIITAQCSFFRDLEIYNRYAEIPVAIPFNRSWIEEINAECIKLGLPTQ